MKTPPLDLAGLRHEYIGRGLRRADLDPNPVGQFDNWFSAAIAAGIRDANAMALATATREGRPSVRIVLLKEFSDAGFVFFTNYQSAKGRQLDQNPQAALAFYWMEVERQIRIEGTVEKTSRQDSEKYFHSRPAGAQIGAWSSPQSEAIDARGVLEARLAEMEQRFASGPIPLPPHWGGFRLKPELFEFWHGRPNRLHDRFRYSRATDGTWNIERLAP